MGDTIKFPSNLGVTPSFQGGGSVIVNPDILPIFWGPYWPGSGEFTVALLVKALDTLCLGSYFDGLKQYGFSGPAQARFARLDTDGGGAISLPAPGPGVNQVAAIDSAVNSYIDNLVKNDLIDNLDDNHQLIVVVFLDPSIPQPRIFDTFGNVTNSVRGDNTSFEKFVLLDDNTRFERCWISTASAQVSTVMQTVSHELAEAISDPFGNGWHQTAPPSSATSGQIGDVCNQPGISNGVGVSAYWSVADAACIIPTSGVRRVNTSFTDNQSPPHDGPAREGFVNFGPICGSGMFGYKERTYSHQLVVSAGFVGFESPAVSWIVDGRPVALEQGFIDVAAAWDPEPPPTRGAPAPVKPTTARLSTWRSSPAASEITITVGPNVGNVMFRIDVSVAESFDTGNVGGQSSSRRIGMIEMDLKNQEIIWDSRHNDVVRNCSSVEHLFVGTGETVGPRQPGDPADLLKQVEQAIEASRTQQLLGVATALEGSRPQLAAALRGLSKHS